MKLTKRGIAMRLNYYFSKRRSHNQPRGEGCPFISVKYRCYNSCGMIFPSIKLIEDIVKCPCMKFDKKYVIRRCDLWIKKYLTNS